VDENGQLAQAQSKGLSGLRLVNRLDALELQEMVARAERADLVGAALAGAGRHGRRFRAVEAAARLGERQLVFRADAEILEQSARTEREHPLEVGAP
jgi:hypothetical protein